MPYLGEIEPEVRERPVRLKMTPQQYFESLLAFDMLLEKAHILTGSHICAGRESAWMLWQEIISDFGNSKKEITSYTEHFLGRVLARSVKLRAPESEHHVESVAVDIKPQQLTLSCVATPRRFCTSSCAWAECAAYDYGTREQEPSRRPIYGTAEQAPTSPLNTSTARSIFLASPRNTSPPGFLRRKSSTGSSVVGGGTI